MHSSVEFPTKSNLSEDVIKYLVENPEVEAFLWKKFSNKLYTESEEKCLVDFIESMKFEDETIRACANGIVGAFYIFTKRSYKNVTKGLEFLNKAVDAKNTNALMNLALMYKLGLDVDKDMLKAKALYEEAAALNNPGAKYCLATMYLVGDKLIDIDVVKATILFREIVSYGDVKTRLRRIQYKYEYRSVIQYDNADLILYHCTMALKVIGVHFSINPKQISEFILDDSLIKDDEAKYQVFIQCAQDNLVATALTCSDRASTFIANQLLKNTPVLTPNLAPLLRKCCFESGAIMKALLSLKKDYPEEMLVQYHYVMAVEPQSLSTLFKQSRQAVVELIVEDGLLDDAQKQQLLLQLFDYKLEELSSYAASASLKVSLFITKALDKLISETALNLRKLHAQSPEKTKPELEVFKEKYPYFATAQYHCVMALEPQNLSALFDLMPALMTIFLKDSLPSENEKYKIILEQLSQANRNKLVAYAFSGPDTLPDTILMKWIFLEYENPENAALAFRASYPSSPKEFTSKFDFLKSKYPNNPVVAYHHAKMLSKSVDIGKLYKQSSKDMSLCILKDESLNKEEKYQLFVDIMNVVDITHFPFPYEAIVFMREQEAEVVNKINQVATKDNVLSEKDVNSNYEYKEKAEKHVKKIGIITCSYNQNELVMTSDFGDEATLRISKNIASCIDNCTNLREFEKIVRTDEMKKCNNRIVADELANLINQYASMKEEASQPIQIEEPFTFTKKSGASVVRDQVDASIKKQDAVSPEEVIIDIHTKIQKPTLAIIDAEFIKELLNHSEAEAAFWKKLSSNPYSKDEEKHLIEGLVLLLETVEDVATLGCVYALLGGIYVFSIYSHKDFDTGLNHLKCSVEYNNASAMVTLGLIYYEGYGIIKNPLEAKLLFEEATLQKHPMAYLNLGIMYLVNHKGVGRDFVKAAAYFRAAFSLYRAKEELKKLKDKYPAHALIQYHSQMAFEPQSMSIFDLYMKDRKIISCIIEDFNLSDEQKYQFLRQIQQESKLKKHPLSEEVILFIDELGAKLMLANHENANLVTESAKEKVHRIGNFTFKFDESSFGIMLSIVSDNRDTATLDVSSKIQDAILSYKSIEEVLELLNSSEMKELNDDKSIHHIVNIFKSYNDIYNDEPDVSISKNENTFFKSAEFENKVDSVELSNNDTMSEGDSIELLDNDDELSGDYFI